MSEANELSGPDLSQGIDAGALSEGRPLLGHAQGEAVMLVRRNDLLAVVTGMAVAALARAAGL